jgi:hypothetical protein
MVNGVSTALRIGSRIACAIVLLSFLLFVVDKAGNASAHQQNEVNASAPPGSAEPHKSEGSSKNSKSSLRKTIDEVSSAIVSPFSGAVTGIQSEWGKEIALTVMALLIYGLGLGYLARVLRVRS